jgi:hypothetical protein
MQSILYTYWHPTPLNYDGSQLHPHMALELSNQYGSGIVAFTGEALVALSEMVDVEDVRKKAPIYSPSMLHFIGEFFHTSLLQGVWMQRLFMSVVYETLTQLNPHILHAGSFQRHGDDLYWYPDGVAELTTRRKLSVSIVAPSVVSSLLHVGLNLSHEGTPVPTAGLQSHELLPTTLSPEAFALEVMSRFKAEYEGIYRASTKVRQVL